jgi:hypothetical protein
MDQNYKESEMFKENKQRFNNTLLFLVPRCLDDEKCFDKKTPGFTKGIVI